MFQPRPQGHGRIDNPDRYTTWYFATSDVAAIGETFGDIPEWSEEMFTYPAVPGARRAVAIYEILDDADLLDMDDPTALLHLGLRPTQVVTRNRSTTQAWALAAFDEAIPARIGIRWWSFHRPQWTIVGLWQPHGQRPPHAHVDTIPLDIRSPSVEAAANELARPIRD